MASACLTPARWSHFLAVEGAVVAIVWLFSRKSLRTFFDDLFGKSYINTLVVEDDRVLAGVDRPQFVFDQTRWLWEGCAAQACGPVFRSAVRLRFRRDEISLAELKSVVERDDCFWRDFWAGRIRRDERPGTTAAGDRRGTANVTAESIFADANRGLDLTERIRISFTLTPLYGFSIQGEGWSMLFYWNTPWRRPCPVPASRPACRKKIHDQGIGRRHMLREIVHWW